MTKLLSVTAIFTLVSGSALAHRTDCAKEAKAAFYLSEEMEESAKNSKISFENYVALDLATHGAVQLYTVYDDVEGSSDCKKIQTSLDAIRATFEDLAR